MFKYIVRRVILIIPMLLGITFISFFIMQLAPGDFLSEQALNPDISEETLNQMRQQFGLDKPPIIQYFYWLRNAVALDFGRSFSWNVPVFFIIKTRLWNTLLLAVLSSAFAWGVAIPIGIHSAVRQYSWSDKLLTTFSFLGLSIPNWFLGLLLLFAIVRLGIDLPVGGMQSIDYDWMSFGEKIVDRIRHLVVPVIVLGTGQTASLMRYMRGNLLEILRQDYVTTARAKGLPDRKVICKHALLNALNPLITIFGFDLGNLLSGAALTEIVLGWPGLGSLTLAAVTGRDLYLVMGSLVMGGVMLVVGNLVADILLGLTDPRIRYS